MRQKLDAHRQHLFNNNFMKTVSYAIVSIGGERIIKLCFEENLKKARKMKAGLQKHYPTLKLSIQKITTIMEYFD